MKNRLILFLFFLTNVCLSQNLPCSVPAASSVTPTMKFMLCDGTTAKHATLFKIIDTTKAAYRASGWTTGLARFDGTKWVVDNSTYLTTSSAASTYIPLSGTSAWAGNITSNGIRSIGHFDATYPSNEATATFYGAGGSLYFSQFKAQTANRNAFFRSYNDESNGDLHSIMSVEWAGGDSAKSLIVPKDSAVTIVNDYGRYNKSQSANIWADTLGWANTGWVKRYVAAYGGSGFLPLTGGTMSGNISTSANSFTVGTTSSGMNFNNGTNKISTFASVNGTFGAQSITTATSSDAFSQMTAFNTSNLASSYRVLKLTQSGNLTYGNNLSTYFGVGENLLSINGVNYVPPSTQGASSTVLTNDGSGNLSWAAGGGGGGATYVGSGNINVSGSNKITVKTDGITLDSNGTGGTLQVKTGGIGTTQLAANAVDSTKIGNGTVSLNDIGSFGASNAQVLAFNGSSWRPSSALGNYLPILGGTLTGTGGNGFAGLPSQSLSAQPSAFGTNSVKIFSNSNGTLSFSQRKGNNSFVDSLNSNNSTFGTVINDSINRATSGYSLTGTNTAQSIVSGKLRLTATTDVTTYGNYISLGYTTWLPEWEYAITLTGVSNGNGIALMIFDNINRGFVAKLDMNSAGNRGTLLIASLSSGTPTTLATSATNAVTYVNGDVVVIKLIRQNYKLIAECWVNGSLSVSVPYNADLNNNGFAIGRVNKLAIAQLGGTQDISNISFKSATLRNKGLAVVGNSISYGFNIAASGATYSDAFAMQVNAALGHNTVQYAASGATSADLLANVQELIRLLGTGKFVSIEIGTNDAIASVSSATFLANLDAICAALVASGNTPILNTVIPTTTAGYNTFITQYNTGINARSTKFQIIDQYTSFVSGGILAAAYTTDGVHLSVAGNNLYATNIINAVPYLKTSNYYMPTSGYVYSTTTTGNGFSLASASVTTGNLVNLAITSTGAASNTQTVLNISNSGANANSTQTTYGAQITNTKTGTSSTNVGLTVSASGGTNNYALLVPSGSVGIGRTDPSVSFPLDVQGNTRIYNSTSPSSTSGGTLVMSSPVPTAADQRMGFFALGAINGTASNSAVSFEGHSAQSWTLGSAQGSYATINTTRIGSATRETRVKIFDNGDITFTQGTSATGTPNGYTFQLASHSGLAAGTESVGVNLGGTNPSYQFATGALALQRLVRIPAETLSFVGSSTCALAASLGVNGCMTAGANAIITQNAAIYVAAGQAGAGTVSAYGLLINAPTGATNNYAAAFLGNVGIGVTSPTSTFHVNGSASFPINTTAKTTAYTITASDHTISCDATTAGFTVTLPTAVGITGRIYVIKKIDATGNVVTVDGNASETIDGSTTQSLDAQWESMMIQSNGANWYILSIN